MHKLELTEEHKKKLLEMCKVFFPEYEIIQFTFNTDEFFTDNWSDTPSFGEILSFSDGAIKGGRSILSNIHWFEFLVLKLLEKVAKHNTLTIAEFEPLLINIYKEETHPVDILYYEYKFKKNKN